MSHRTWSHLTCQGILASIALLALGPVAAGAAPKPFTQSSDAVVVEVPVQVVAAGEPVRGLTAANFELYDGRKKVALSGFDVLDLTVAGVGNAAPVPAAARRHFLLLFDLLYSDLNSFGRAREAAKSALATLHPADLVAVATYSATEGPQLVLGFTPDRAQAAAAIDRLGVPPQFNGASDPLRLVLVPHGPRLRSGDGDAATAVAAEVPPADDQVTLVSSRGERSLDQMIVRNMTQQLGELARTIAAVDGRKYVVLLSEGFDTSLVTGNASATTTNDVQAIIDEAGELSGYSGQLGGSGSDDTFGDTRSQNLLERMLTEFRRADCQIQAVDIGGLRALAGEGRQRSNRRESLLTLSKSTGGDLYENSNDVAAAMGQMLRRTAVTYVLSFQPERLALDGEFHKLRVELKSPPPGARLVHRPGYYAPQPYREQSALQRRLATGSAVMGEAGGSIDTAVLAAPFAGSAGYAYVPVVVEVGGRSLLAGKPEPTLPLELYVYAIDAQGTVQDYRSESLAFDVAKAGAQLRDGGVKYFGHLLLPPGSYAIRTLVRNAGSGASSLAVSELTVPSYGGGEPALLPPMFPEAPGRWLAVRATMAPGEAPPPYPFLLDGQAFIPASRPALVPGEGTAVVLQGYNLGSGELSAKVEVLAADGTAVPGGELALAPQGAAAGAALRTLTGTFRAAGLRPGEYLLRVTLTDGAGTSTSSSGRFVVHG